MDVRLATISDLKEVHAPAINPDRDIVFASHSCNDGRLLGVLALRPMYYAHSFITVAGTMERHAAEALYHHIEGFVNHARNFARPGEWAGYGTIFQIADGNDRMKRFIESKGGHSEPASTIYRIDL